DLDGARLRAYLSTAGGRASVRMGNDPLDIENGRGDVMTSFSSAGPTDFGHQLKPDVAAPGGQILSSTLPEFAGSPFAVFDGTSMATPHVTGAVALLLARHRGWTPTLVKSALMSTAGPAWLDTSHTIEAPTNLEGAGLIDVDRADSPLIFTLPQSLSFHDLDVDAGGVRRPLLVTVSDAGGGGGKWKLSVQPEVTSLGAGVEVPPSVEV